MTRVRADDVASHPERTLARTLHVVTPDDVLVPVVSSWVVLVETVERSKLGGRPKRRR